MSQHVSTILNTACVSILLLCMYVKVGFYGDSITFTLSNTVSQLPILPIYCPDLSSTIPAVASSASLHQSSIPSDERCQHTLSSLLPLTFNFFILDRVIPFGIIGAFRSYRIESELCMTYGCDFMLDSLAKRKEQVAVISVFEKANVNLNFTKQGTSFHFRVIAKKRRT